MQLGAIWFHLHRSTVLSHFGQCRYEMNKCCFQHLGTNRHIRFFFKLQARKRDCSWILTPRQYFPLKKVYFSPKLCSGHLALLCWWSWQFDMPVSSRIGLFSYQKYNEYFAAQRRYHFQSPTNVKMLFATRYTYINTSCFEATVTPYFNMQNPWRITHCYNRPWNHSNGWQKINIIYIYYGFKKMVAGGK